MDQAFSEMHTRTAIADVEHRTWLLRKSIWDYIKLMNLQMQQAPSAEGYDLDQRRLNSEADRELEHILLNAKQWYKAITRSTLPRDTRKEIRNAIDKDLRETVECLRDIREHWEETRRHFESAEIEVPENQSNVRWFKEAYPDANPWSSGMSVGIGYYIAGPEVLNLHNLLVDADKVGAIMNLD